MKEAAMRTARGATLIEVMIAMGVLLIGAAGVTGLQRQSQAFLGDARRLTRAAFVAQDLANQIQLWRFDDVRLADVVSSADIADAAGVFLTDEDPVGNGFADHGEADLTAGSMSWNGLDGGVLAASGMERFWNVAEPDDANSNGVADSKRIAVIVRWPAGAGWRRYVFYTVKVNPEDRR
jgi:prepilin-type N-terminal cleavage/methylation domain-containing protein